MRHDEPASPGDEEPIAMAWTAPPPAGGVIEVAEGILWARLPLPMALDHVNIYALDDGDGWTLVDTGLDWKRGRAVFEALRAGPLAGRPIARVILTHHHPDHIGLAGLLAREGAEILASRVAWLSGRMLTLDRQDAPGPEQIAFRRRAGVVGAALDAYAAERPFNFADCVAPIPPGFTALEEGAVLEAGGRRWRLRLGEGHAPAHATLWEEGAAGRPLLLAGDQLLATISPNIGVYPNEPGADPLAGWLESCARLRAPAVTAQPLVLPGHHLPFTGAARRLRLLAENHAGALERVMAALAKRPMTAIELFAALFGRPIGPAEQGLALVEAVAHVNWLARRGAVAWRETVDGALLWHPTGETAWRAALAGSESANASR